MSEVQLSTRRELELMQYLQQLADARAQREQQLATTLANEEAAAEKEHQTTLSKLTTDFTQKRRSLENDYAAAKLAAGQELRDSKAELDVQHQAEQQRIAADHKQLGLLIERKHKQQQWESLAVFDAAKDAPQQMLDQASKRIQARKLQVDGLERDALTLLAMRRLSKYADSAAGEEPNLADTTVHAEERHQSALTELHRKVLELQAQTLPSLLLEGHRIIFWFLLATMLMIGPALLVTNYSIALTALMAPLFGFIITGGCYLILKPRAARQSLEQFARIQSQLKQARHWETISWQQAQERSRQESEAIHHRRQQDLMAAQDVRDKAIAEGDLKKEELTGLAAQRLQSRREEAHARYQEVLAAAEEKYPSSLDELATARQEAWQANETRNSQRISAAKSSHESDWQAMADEWHAGFRGVVDELSAMQAVCDRFFPDWNVTVWQSWQRPTSIPLAFQFGHCKLPLQAVKNGVSSDPRLVPEQTQLELPTWLSLQEHPRLVLTVDGAGRAAAAEVLQLMMLRFLTATPAGKLRFTIIDPTAFGQNFAMFMHLGDHDEQLVGKRILTDPRQIEDRLAQIGDHMERVVQKYLRNDFPSIHDYNTAAGEVSEPYHVIVVANFPAGLSDSAVRKLKTLATAGPKCGVYTLLSIDSSVKLPTDFNMADMLSGAVHLDWTGDGFRWKYPLFEKLALQIDTLPEKEKLNELLRLAGEASRLASRVEVPFAVVAPTVEKMWSETCDNELSIPIGRAGAHELQFFKLGQGTSQHALISGKTGSGKSTLLHALVTNAALRYSPSEVEFYLVDFKKGVEFKTYATHQLPHARVIAIESEREFGVSVLERLDAELKHRGELFRRLGVQDLASYRRESRQTLPRILLAIDEFQELFVADDKLSQDAALLLDRLVRQGRAFGVHVLLGSQTLSGAYSIARSTLGQMAVRIALECSEADAHLILSDDNPAARLLSRPGEAIYNDQNGMTQGNQLFQVVWLSERERQEYLAEIRVRQQVEELAVPPAIVFEGNVPADPLQNAALTATITSDAQQTTAEPAIWLGSAVRIEPPTQMTFRRQGGHNLLVVGQDESLALGIMTSAVVALAAQVADESESITVLDGTRPESTSRGAWPTLAQSLAGRVSVFSPRETSRLIAELADEVARRLQRPDAEHAARFLVIHDLAQIRDLRLTEEEFSFSSNGKPPSVDKRFREILREGPALGVHVLMWCESNNSLLRFVDRTTMREIDYRVVMQMSAVDSTSLIDSPAAGRIGEHRAIFYRDDTGSQTKFRPYGRPSEEWLAYLGENSGTWLRAGSSRARN